MREDQLIDEITGILATISGRFADEVDYLFTDKIENMEYLDDDESRVALLKKLKLDLVRYRDSE